MTDPKGRWKTYYTDAWGNLNMVREPKGSGAVLTNYTYSITGKLVGVSMPRDTGTQTCQDALFPSNQKHTWKVPWTRA